MAPAGASLVKGGTYSLAVESGRLVKRDGISAGHTATLTLAAPAVVSGIRAVRHTVEYDLTGSNPGVAFQWSPLFNGNPSSAVMQVRVQLSSEGALTVSGAGSRVTDPQSLVETIPVTGTMVATVNDSQVLVEVDGTLVATAAISGAYTLNPEQTPAVVLSAVTPALDSLLIEVGT